MSLRARSLNPSFYRSTASVVTMLIGFWLLGGSTGLAQVAKAQPVPDGATRIDIKTSLSDSLLFERVVTLLQADGYSGNFRTEKAKIVTDSRGIDSGDWTARIVAVLEKGTVQLLTEGNDKTANPPVVNERLTYKGKPDGPNRAGFARLDAFAHHLAKSIVGATLTYQVMP
ncbi:hypothetical protein [Spirosoma rhododendri]|uniref:Uncharacterized protein n=1 Tax=Spirosoma rhododendri TaxID=2728024 RepID=A0A7L5DND7_9BACT|nr:hypothetical protein [Spirosoma rhododendri]QJD80004.1 hypothetical protein HH216_17495 [Spirosoma rhododendri]